MWLVAGFGFLSNLSIGFSTRVVRLPTVCTSAPIILLPTRPITAFPIGAFLRGLTVLPSNSVCVAGRRIKTIVQLSMSNGLAVCTRLDNGIDNVT